jgi:hypothetical protein
MRYRDGKFFEFVPDTPCTPEEVVQLHFENKFFYLFGKRRPAGFFMFMRPFSGTDIFPNFKDSFRGNQSKETFRVFGSLEQGSDNIFFMRFKRNTNTVLFYGTCKSLNSLLLHEEDMNKAVSVSETE